MTQAKRAACCRITMSAMSAPILAGMLASGSLKAQEQQGGTELEEVVVTGSRIARRDFSAASPIMTVGQEQLENLSTIGIESALNQLPQFVPGGGSGGPGAGTQFGTGDVQSSARNSPGISMLNLRGLGPNRNLVLINGRRAQPANASLVVDVNSIPAAAIESVEVITGGASAVYGADAVGGVVNFKLRENFEGIAFGFQTSGQEQGGGAESRFSALVGGNFDNGRGNGMVGMEWAKRNEVRQIDRDFYVDGWADPGTGGGTIPDYPRFDTQFPNFPSQAAIGALFPNSPGLSPDTDFHFNSDGTAFTQAGAINYRGSVAPQDYRFKIEDNGDLGSNFIEGLVSSPLERYSIFARASYDITERMRGFVQGNFTSVAVDQVLQESISTGFWGASIPNDGRPLPADLQTLLDSRPDPGAPWALTHLTSYLGPRTSENNNRVLQIMTGVEGDVGDGDWTYDAYFSHGETTIGNRLGGFASTGRLRAVLEAPNWGAGFVNAAGGFVGFQASCTSGLPVFTNLTPSQDCIDAVTIDMTNTNELEQDVVEANFQGPIIDMPAGELRGAIGVSSRKNTFEFRPDPYLDAENIIDLPVGLAAASDTGGSTSVDEVYGELLIPMTPRFNLELGARSSDYDTTGRIETYKALFDWRAGDSVRLRGGRQVANRAPNTAELFQGRTQAVVGLSFSDPCAVSTMAPWGNVPGNPRRAEVQVLCSAMINAAAGMPSTFDLDPDNYDTFFGFFPFEVDSRTGNPDVQNEEAETYTFGVVWTGEAWTVAVDWYDIDIANAIAAPSADTVYEQCFNADGVSNPELTIDGSPFCALIVRDPLTGGRVQVNTRPVNIGGIRTSGVDFQINWNKAVGPGNLFLNLVVNYLDKYETTDTPTSAFLDAAGTLAEGGQFDYRLFANLTYAAGGNWSVGARLRYLPSALDASVVNNPATAILGVDSHQIADLFGSYRISESMSLRAGIDNLLDADPEIVGENPGVDNNRGNTIPGYYDVLGRRLWVGFNVGF